MILLWGLRLDSPLDRVAAELARAASPALFLDQRDSLEVELELEVGESVTGSLRWGSHALDLAAVTAAYMRPHEADLLPSVRHADPAGPERQHALNLVEGLTIWAEVTPALVLSRPAASATNASKPFQALTIEAAGFRIPETLLTTEPEAVREFVAAHGQVVYKSISGIRSIVSRFTPAHLERLADVSACPTQFQRWIPGTDHRIHVVGEEVFACEVRSDADDYRYAARQGSSVELDACQLPEDCADRCRALAADLGLTLAGVDLRRTPEGEWFCFEVNPSPAFTYYDDAHSGAVAAAVARLLAATCERTEDTQALDMSRGRDDPRRSAGASVGEQGQAAA